jgi:hypothetical protein
MGRATIIVSNDNDRLLAASWAQKSPDGTRIEFKRSKRTLPQNDRMWAMLTEFSRQLPWHGLMLAPDDWKLLFLDALKREVRMVPNLDDNGMVSLGRSSSDLSKDEMGDLMTLMESFGASHGVKFKDEEAA